MDLSVAQEQNMEYDEEVEGERMLHNTCDDDFVHMVLQLVSFRGSFHANQLPLPGLWSAAVHESSHVSSAISSNQTFAFLPLPVN